MKSVALLKLILIIIFPLLLFLLASYFTVFDGSFYQKEFAIYEVEKNAPQPISLNEKVMDFIKGKTYELPAVFNDREKQHLLDVRKIVSISTILLYISILLIIILMIAALIILKLKNLMLGFLGKVLVFGGILTILLATLLFLLIISDFSSTFESFHRMLFDEGTYTFDPAKEIIVRMYPEQIFMDLGIRISLNVAILSAAIIFLGIYIILKSKNKKIKKKW